MFSVQHLVVCSFPLPELEQKTHFSLRMECEKVVTSFQYCGKQGRRQHKLSSEPQLRIPHINKDTRSHTHQQNQRRPPLPVTVCFYFTSMPWHHANVLRTEDDSPIICC